MDSKSIDKAKYKLVLLSIKVIPVMLAVMAALTTLLDYITYDTTWINYIILGTLILFMYLVSWVFRFCIYHRMFLHYFTAMNLISVYDVYIGIPVDNYQLMQLYIVFTCICLCIILYLYLKSRKKDKTHGQ